MSFLDDVLVVKQGEVEALRLNPPARSRAPRASGFAEALRGSGLSVIAEIKRRSPSKGDMAPGLDAAAMVRAYARGGAAAVSCLTDRGFFGARDADFEAAGASSLPRLRKDFIIDELQIDESAAMGAAAILLIVRILDDARLTALHAHASELGLDVLVEVHDEAEIDRALASGAALIGVNNRDLATLHVDPHRAERLRPRIPAGVVSVAESGVRRREDVQRIEAAGFDAVLIGETLATSPDPAATLRALLGSSEAVAS